ncbi:MAG: SDR family NAD(P)-dependent oxidoreductase, partial [Myxococcota bacterium]
MFRCWRRTGACPTVLENLMTAKILLTGATGTIGRATLRALQNQQHAVRIASRASERARELAHERDDVVEFDFDDAESMSKAFEGI